MLVVEALAEVLEPACRADAGDHRSCAVEMAAIEQALRRALMVALPLQDVAEPGSPPAYRVERQHDHRVVVRSGPPRRSELAAASSAAARADRAGAARRRARRRGAAHRLQLRTAGPGGGDVRELVTQRDVVGHDGRLGVQSRGDRYAREPVSRAAGSLDAAMAHEFIYTCYKLARFYPPDRTVLENISLSFYPGAKIGVIGSNGAGKSSLLKIMAGLDDGYQRRGPADARASPSATSPRSRSSTRPRTSRAT